MSVSTQQPEPSTEAQVSQLRLDGGFEIAAPAPEELEALIEALLIVAPAPPTVGELVEAIGVDERAIEAAISRMSEQPDRGWIVQRHGGTVHLASAPRFARHVRAFLGLEREGKLSSAALETLAIIAYRQPITRAEIDAIRGVDSSGVLATLHARELIEPVGRVASVGNPFQYGTTAGFLRLFGLRSLDDLPALGLVNGLPAQSLLTSPDPDTTPGDEPLGTHRERS